MGAALVLVGLSCLRGRGVPRRKMIPKESGRPGLGISGPLERHQAQTIPRSQSLDFCRTEMGWGGGGSLTASVLTLPSGESNLARSLIFSPH